MRELSGIPKYLAVIAVIIFYTIDFGMEYGIVSASIFLIPSVILIFAFLEKPDQKDQTNYFEIKRIGPHIKVTSMKRRKVYD